MKMMDANYLQIKAAEKLHSLAGLLILCVMGIGFILSKEPAAAMITGYWIFTILHAEI